MLYRVKQAQCFPPVQTLVLFAPVVKAFGEKQGKRSKGFVVSEALAAAV